MAVNPTNVLTRLGKFWRGVLSIQEFAQAGDLTAAGGLRSLGDMEERIHDEYAIQDKGRIEDVHAVFAGIKQTVTSQAVAITNMIKTDLVGELNQDQLLPDNQEETAVRQFIADMIEVGATVQRSTCTVTPNVGAGNTGTGTILATLTRGDGLVSEQARAETIEITCTRDHASSQTAVRSEVFTLRGEQNEAANSLSFNYPSGSGATATVSTSIFSSSTVLSNTGFDSFNATTNLFTGWTINNGVAGTDIVQETTVKTGVHSTSSAKFIDGTTASLEFRVRDITVTNSINLIRPETNYAVSFWVDREAALTAGELRFEMVDGTDTVINDNLGAPNSIPALLAPIVAGTFTQFTGWFRTPRVLPEIVTIRFRPETAPTGGAAFVDDLAFVTPTEAYPGGPELAIFPGTTPFVLADSFTLDVTNDRAGIFQDMFQRIYPMTTWGVQLPSALAPTINDATLVV